MSNSKKTYDLQIADLERLVKEDKFDAAAELCKSGIASGLNHEFWTTQLAYTYFLNKHDDNARYIKSEALFRGLVESYPRNANSHFWLGYISYILFNDLQTAKKHFF